MSALLPGWAPVLQSPATSKVELLIISPQGQDPLEPDFVTSPDVLRYATHRNALVTETATGIVWPFWPWVGDWIVVQRTIVREDRRAEIPNVPVHILAQAQLAREFAKLGSGLVATYQLWLWSPGIPLENCILLMRGRLRSPTWDRLDGAVSATLTDGSPEVAISVPSPVTFDEVPGAPQLTLDTQTWQTIVGQMPDQVYAFPVDVDSSGKSRTFAVSTPTMSAAPTAVYVDQILLATNAWHIEDLVTLGLAPRTYTAIVLVTPIAPTSTVTCSGGVGLDQVDPIKFLLDAGNLPATPEALQLLDAMQSLDFQLLLNNTGSVLDLLDDAVAQTHFANGWKHGAYHLYLLDAVAPSIPLGLGNGLLFRLTAQPDPTDETRVYNVLVLRCGRDMVGGTPLFTVYRDKDHGPETIRALLYDSEQRYGRRPFPDGGSSQITSGYQGLDLAVTDSGTDQAKSDAGEDLGDFLSAMHASQNPRVAYQALWYEGMAIEENNEAPVTDQDYRDQDSRVVIWTLAATGPQITCQIAVPT